MNKPKNFIFGEDARSNLLAGMKIGHDAIFQTTEDISSLLQNLNSPNQFIDSGRLMMKDVAKKMEKKSPASVAFTILLTYKICEEAFKLIKLNHCPFLLTKSLDDGVNSVIDALEKGIIFNEINSKEHLHIHSDLITAELQSVNVLLFNTSISSPHNLLPLLQEIAFTSKALLIIAHDFDGDTLSTLTINNLQGHLNVTTFSAPSFPDHRLKFLESLALVTGATLITGEPTTKSLGFANKITIGNNRSNNSPPFSFPINLKESPGLMILESAFKWASSYSISLKSPEIMNFAVQTAFEYSRIFLLTDVLILEETK
jgi:hypothetical protein